MHQGAYIDFNTLRPEQNAGHFTSIFEKMILKEILRFDSNFIEMSSWGFNWY